MIVAFISAALNNARRCINPLSALGLSGDVFLGLGSNDDNRKSVTSKTDIELIAVVAY